MPKKSKPNAFSAYLKEHRKKFRRRGRSDDEVQKLCHDEFKKLSEEQKAEYKLKAKEIHEHKKPDLTRKYTNTGESYAELQERQDTEKRAHERFERLIDNLTTESREIDQADRNFIVIKTIHSCIEDNIDPQIYWPLELAIGVFNLKDGLKSHYWTLINTKQLPSGFAVDANDACEVTRRVMTRLLYTTTDGQMLYGTQASQCL